MKPNITFIKEDGRWWIYPPLQKRRIGGTSLKETFQIAFNQFLIAKRETVRLQTPTAVEDLDFEDVVELNCKFNGE